MINENSSTGWKVDFGDSLKDSTKEKVNSNSSSSNSNN
jgi:hypothetical protein